MSQLEAGVVQQRREREPVVKAVEELFSKADAANVPSGIFHWSYFRPFLIRSFNGTEWCGVCDTGTWMQIYTELHAGQRGTSRMESTDALRGRVRDYAEKELVPIAVAHYDYHAPARGFAARVLSAVRRQDPDAVRSLGAGGDELEAGKAFLAAALLPDRSDGFRLLPYVHSGFDVRFVVPRELYLSNVSAEPEGLEVDFDDGRGYRPVAFDQVVEVEYGDELPKTLRLRLKVGGKWLNAAFHFLVQPLAPKPNEVWTFEVPSPYPGVDKAVGWGMVYYGEGHTGVVEPVIFSDGFGEGATDFSQLWNGVNSQSLATRLLRQGKDLILLGYKQRDTYLQANAAVAAACIEKAIASRQGRAPLIVGGASMGGLITRYALARMEHMGRDHQTAKYFSFDTPHDGAWVPLILQYFAYYFENHSDQAKRLANLMRSPAAQQMMWGWVGSWDYSGPVTNNPLRKKFYEELGGFGWFPRRPRKYAVANGRGDGVGNETKPGEMAFDWSGNLCVGARPRIEPHPGKDVYLGDMWLLGYWTWYYATNVPAFDSAPGGTSDFFGQAGDGAKNSGYGWTTIYYRTSCFIPTVSALSLGRMYDPYVDISRVPRGQCPFDEFYCCTRNTGHVEVTPEIANWILARVGAPSPAESEPFATSAEAAGSPA